MYLAYYSVHHGSEERLIGVFPTLEGAKEYLKGFVEPGANFIQTLTVRWVFLTTEVLVCRGRVSTQGKISWRKVPSKAHTKVLNDEVIQFAYQLLNRDPQALDVLQDVLRRGQ